MKESEKIMEQADEIEKAKPTKAQLLKDERSNLLKGLKLIAPIFPKLLDESVAAIKSAVTNRIAEIDVELAIS